MRHQYCKQLVMTPGPGGTLQHYWRDFDRSRFGTVVILTRPVQWTENAFAVRYATKWTELANRFISVQYGWTCIL